MTVTCGLCENEIKTGDTREIRRGETAHTYCARRQDAVESYRFFIHNPAADPKVGFALYYVNADREYPVLSNTGGLTIYASARVGYGEGGIPVNPEFVTAFGLGWHWLQCYRPMSDDQFERAFDHIEEMYYDGTMGDHERWALVQLLVHSLLSDSPLPPEFKPLVDFADQCTTFGVPEVADE